MGPLDFELRVDFVAGSGEPTRVFEAMIELVRAVEYLDEELCRSLGRGCATRLVLQQISSGSLLARFTQLIDEIPDEALKNADWNRIVGHFLLKAKYAFLAWAKKRKRIEKRADVLEIQDALIKVAQESHIKLIPAYAPIPIPALVAAARMLQDAVSNLAPEERAEFYALGEAVDITGDFEVPEDIMRDLVVSQVLSSEGIRVVKVKKPDFLGKSKWLVKYQDTAIDVPIRDSAWLENFHDQKVAVLPGDSLKVRLLEEFSYGHNGELVARHYEIMEVLDVIRAREHGQSSLFADDL
jgi:hypothetical protein